MAAVFPLPHDDEIMDVLIDVRYEARQGVRLVFIDSAGREVALRLSGNVAQDLRDELLALGEGLY
jgi:hypothetical protein